MREYAVGDEPVPGYQITRPLGAGGYGTVWVAKSPGDVEIALKIINLQGQGLKEFRAISLVKRLRHPNLIPIYAFWLKDEMGKYIGPPLTVVRIDARGQLVEVTESKFGPASRLQSDLPFKLVLPPGPFALYLLSVTFYGMLYTLLVILFGLVLFEDRDLA